MPIGEPTAQTKASSKYQQKVGLISKSYKLKKEVVEAFADACNQRGLSQSKVLTDFMMEFCKKNN